MNDGAFPFAPFTLLRAPERLFTVDGLPLRDDTVLRAPLRLFTVKGAPLSEETVLRAGVLERVAPAVVALRLAEGAVAVPA